MGKIDDMIREMCPEGVEYVSIGSIMSVSRGASPRPISKYITDSKNGVPWIKIGDVNPFSKYITSTNEFITPEGASHSRMLHKGDFILSNSMSFGRPYILGIDGCIHDGWIALNNYEQKIDASFLYYILRSEDVQTYWTRQANSGGAVSNLNSDIVRSTEIPVPPLSVQQEIVRILDKFSTLTSDLTSGLPAEIDAVNKQYEYYRNKLLTFKRKGA